MPKGTVRRVRRTIAGLLVLTVLLLSGAQASMAMLPNTHHHETAIAGQTLTAASDDVTAPACNDDGDHGLPCCIGGQCVAHAYWMPARTADLPSLSKLVAVRLPHRDLLLDGIATQPASPPPRAAV